MSLQSHMLQSQEPEELTGRYYVNRAIIILEKVIEDNCIDPKNNCDLDKKTIRNINIAIDLLIDALEYFEDDNHLISTYGLDFYDTRL